MASIPGRIFSAVARAAGNVNPNIVEQKHKNVVKDLRSMEPLFRHYIAPIGYRFVKAEADGVPVEVFSKKKNASDKVIFVVHGGAYISRMMFYYRLLNKRYSKAAGGGTVIHFEYRCAPEALYPAALEDTMKVWKWMLDQGIKEENVMVIGDSAGGHLSVNLMMKLRELGQKMPKAAILMSPWLDMTASGESYVYNYKVDPVFGIKGQTPSAEEVKKMLMTSELYMWLGDHERTDPYISPVYNEFDGGYPPMLVTAGGNEMLLSDSKTLVEKLKKAGVDARLYIGDGMFHVFNVYQLFPESQKALRTMCAYIREQFGTK
ncbi:MAG: alpha/beta hydrolase [Clostridia bacterium]|nr:alpha/beta hydrolase [Clostridia bacterium]